MRTSQPTATNNSALAGPQGAGRGGLGSAAGPRLPVAPRERKPALAALAVLLILGGALVSAYLVMASGQRVSAIQIAAPVPAGQQIPLSALREVQIGDTGIGYIAWTERFKVSQAYAAVPLVNGALLTNGMLVTTSSSANGRVVVGLSLKAGQYPAGGLSEGAHVAVFAVGDNARSGSVLADDAIVYQINRASSSSVQSDTTSVSVSVPPDQAAAVVQAASAGQVGVVLLPTGSKVVQAPAQQPPAAPRQHQSTSPSTAPSGQRSP